MRFKDVYGEVLRDAGLEKEYLEGEKKFSARLGTAHLFLRRLLRVDCIPYAIIKEMWLEDEHVDCPTSEFPFEGNIFRLHFITDAPKPCILEVDSIVKAERIFDAVKQRAPEAIAKKRVIR